ncbi:MAG: SRPBCC family protein [Bacteroidales bacterium]
MSEASYKRIEVKCLVNSSMEKVWECWTSPGHIIHWNQASDDWWTPYAVNDLRVGGQFSWRMEARDGSMGFDFSGKFLQVEKNHHIQSGLDDGRKSEIFFTEETNGVLVKEIFDAENTNPLEMQRFGWQAILDNFKKYVEQLNRLEKLHFEYSILAKTDRVYQAMLDPEYYKQWSAEFNPGSYFQGSWEKGSKILFLGTGPDGKPGGMVSRIKENIPNRFVSIEHLGMYKDGKEVFTGKDVEEWAGALENYSFISRDDYTILRVDMDSGKEFSGYFKETWPRAVDKLKKIIENK